MHVTAGSRLGPYEVVAPLGAGGMGEVWKARDTRLERSVAIKVLPPAFAENAQLKMRFEREARTISQLNHPNICTLYDVGDGYLVMELLEGQSLADRIAKGPLPLDQVIRCGVEIAEALEKAHKAGVVHRDLKPGNVMLTKSGAKLLDFGLAKPANDGVVAALSSLRTEKRSLTEEGTILGTFQYMAPEQLEGGDVDARTDIFALGAVLYEMATARHAFEGKSKASLIASILTSEPQPVSAIQPMTPTSFDRLVRTCLAKDPDERWQSAHDVATELRWIGEGSADERRSRAKRDIVAWNVAAAFAAATIVLGAVAWRNARARHDDTPVRTSLLPPDKTEFSFVNVGAAATPALSPDGTKIVFGARAAGTQSEQALWIRSLDSLVPQQLAGTEGASCPFWSPDGRFVAFFDNANLKKIEVGGGTPVVICPVVVGRGGSWSPDGQTIIFAARYSPIFRVPAAGGKPEPITKGDPRFSTQRWPEFLPDGRHFLFLASPTGNEDRANVIYVGSTDGALQRPLITAATEPHFLNGCILFTRDHILTAQRFDDKKLVTVGDPMPLKEQQVGAWSLASKSILSLAPSGTLVYQIGTSVAKSRLTWFDRSGKVLGTVGEDAPYQAIRIAPDGKSVLVEYNFAGSQSNLWLLDVVGGRKMRATFGNGVDRSPVWSPDGQTIVYSSSAAGATSLMMKSLATGAEQPLLVQQAPPGLTVPLSWSRDGQNVLFRGPGRADRSDLYWTSLADRKTHVYLSTPFIENNGQFSPDGKWVAYQSDESGPIEVYLGPFPPTGAKWQVSAAGGGAPRWRADGRELFYYSPSPKPGLHAVPIVLGATPQIGQPMLLFSFQPGAGVTYDVAPDGQRLLVSTSTGEAPPPAPLTGGAAFRSGAARRARAAAVMQGNVTPNQRVKRP